MLQALIGPVMGIAQNFMETRKVKVEQKAKIEAAEVKAKIKRLENAAQSVEDYDLEALKQTKYSYKDEFAMIVVVAPFICSFLPWTQDYVRDGWIHLTEHSPSWYGPLFCAVIAASMGIRWAVSALGKKK
tara:strand:- start:86 stop:475 length:390 start_codon:yes stop_codon:yes gene_type:complete